jgi:hypothetical protein
VTGTAAVGNGEFWTPDDPGLRVRGVFTAEIGKNLEVHLDADLVPNPLVVEVPGGRALSADPARVVESFLPITLQGQLDSNESVTLLDAQKYGVGAWFGPPRYVADAAVLGANVAGVDQRYRGVRFRMDDPYWLAHLAVGQSSVVDDGISSLGVEGSDEGNWLVYETSAPVTLRDLEIRVLSGCRALVQLVALDHVLVTRETEVRVNPAGSWLTVRGPAFCALLDGADTEMLVPREELTVERFAKWIPLNDTLDGLAWGVATPVEGVLQVQVQVVTSLVEGLHRRLPYQQSKFPAATGKALDRVKQAARRAAKAKAETEKNLDPDRIREAVMDAVSRVEDVDYVQRAEVVVAETCGAVPEISEYVANLPERLAKARNDFAHQLPQDETKEPFARRVLRWLVVARITPWLLRVLLLLRAGIEPQVVRKGCLACGRFGLFRANTAQLVSELGWELPSADTAPADDGT